MEKKLIYGDYFIANGTVYETKHAYIHFKFPQGQVLFRKAWELLVADPLFRGVVSGDSIMFEKGKKFDDV